jgi:hypothetical protein
MEVLRYSLKQRNLMPLMDTFMLYRDHNGTKRRIAPDLQLIPLRPLNSSLKSYDLDFEPPPYCVVEVVSPESKDKDLNKNVGLYVDYLQIPTYLVIDVMMLQDKPHLTLHLWRLQGGRAVKMLPDAEGKFFLPEAGLNIVAKGERFVFTDAYTGEDVFDAEQLYTIKQQLEHQLRLAEARAEAEAEMRRAAEAKAKFEAEMRRAAEAKANAVEANALAIEAKALAIEAKANAEAEARKAVEARVDAEAEARRTAEAKANAEAEARKAVEARVKAVEARANAETEARKAVEARVDAEAEARQAAEAKALAIEAKANAIEAKADAEADARRAAEARVEAVEAKANAEAEARRAAEAKAKKEAEAKRAAEAKALAEAEARKAAEAKAKAASEELARLRAQLARRG